MTKYKLFSTKGSKGASNSSGNSFTTNTEDVDVIIKTFFFERKYLRTLFNIF